MKNISDILIAAGEDKGFNKEYGVQMRLLIKKALVGILMAELMLLFGFIQFGEYNPAAEISEQPIDQWEIVKPTKHITEYRGNGRGKITIQPNQNAFDRARKRYKKSDLRIKQIKKDGKFRYGLDNEFSIRMSDQLDSVRIGNSVGNFVEYAFLDVAQTTGSTLITESINKSALTLQETGRYQSAKKRFRKNTDIEIIPTQTGYKENITLLNAEAPNAFLWKIDSDLEYTLTGSRLQFGDEFTSYLYAYDANENDVTVSLSISGDTLTAVVDTTGAVFPIVLDPSTEITTSSSISATVRMSDTATQKFSITRTAVDGDYYYTTYVWIGVEDQSHDMKVNRALLTFPLEDLNVPKDVQIDSAVIEMKPISVNLSADSTIHITGYTGYYTAYDSTAFNQFDGWLSGTATYNGTAILDTVEMQSTEYEWQSWKLTDVGLDTLFDRVRTGDSLKVMMLSLEDVNYDSIATGKYVGFDNAGTGNNPKLTVYYTNPIQNVTITHKTYKSVTVDYDTTIFLLPDPPMNDDSLVIYLPFDGNVNDYSGEGNNATNNGAVFTSDIDSVQLGTGAIVFDDAGDYVSLAGLDSTLEFSVMMYVRFASGETGNEATLFQSQAGYWNGAVLYKNATDKLVLTCNVSNSLVFPDSLTNEDGRTHVAVTFNSGTGKGYINGDSVIVNTSMNNPLDYWTSPQIGAWGGGGSTYQFTGEMDEFKFFDRALTSDEIAEYYNRTKPGPNAEIDSFAVFVADYPQNTDSLKIYLPMNGDLTDASGNGNHGTGTGVYAVNTERGGWGYSFKKDNDWIALPAMDSTGIFTINMWLSDLSGVVLFTSQSGSNQQGIDVRRIGNNFAFYTGGTGAGNSVGTSGGYTSDDGWILLSARHDGTNATIEVYTESGRHESVTEVQTLPNDYFASPIIGAFSTGGSFDYGGLIDEFKFYSRHLSAAEIAEYYRETVVPRRSEFEMGMTITTADSLRQNRSYSFAVLGFINVEIYSASSVFSCTTDSLFGYAPFGLQFESHNFSEVVFSVIDTSGFKSKKLVFKDTLNNIIGDTISLGSANPDTLYDTLDFVSYYDSSAVIDVVMVDTIGRIFNNNNDISGCR